ncbi:hypothetical protein DIJ64_13535 [Mycobacterium leprae]|uniref:Uncharacterized protein n=1 Tax=Mycobacterium leprae TaxID=1769 RepID=A0AAD0P5J2_MYCLR|nr:hypothetical protein DIJ64_13535 [Mycobacterium leprae]
MAEPALTTQLSHIRADELREHTIELLEHPIQFTFVVEAQFAEFALGSRFMFDWYLTDVVWHNSVRG